MRPERRCQVTDLFFCNLGWLPSSALVTRDSSPMVTTSLMARREPDNRRKINAQLSDQELELLRGLAARYRTSSVAIVTAAIRCVMRLPESTVRAIVAQYGSPHIEDT